MTMLRLLILHRSRRLRCPTTIISPGITAASNFSNHGESLALALRYPGFACTSSTFSTAGDARRRRRRRTKPPPVDQSLLDLAVSRLPPRFSAPDLADALACLPDPRLCPHLFSWAMDRHRRRLTADHSPFLAAVKRLGAARLYRDMDAVASLVLALPFSLPPAEPHLNTLLYFYAEARMLPKAVHVYTRMRASPDPAAHPTAATYNLLFAAMLGHDDASSYIHHVHMGTVRLLFRQMVDAGIAPDRLALNAIVKGYAQSLHLNDALRVFHQMGPVHGCEPDEHTYSLLVHGLCAQGRTRNARELFVEMRGKGMVPSRRACNSLVCALALAGETRDGEEVMWGVARVGRAPDLITCRTLLEEICRQGRVGEAMELLRKMGEEELVDGRIQRELQHGIEDEFGDLDA
ncbi:pentatricopeptide repeat-containing protein At2g27800, mitochondrial [Musa acuminata AAA Group]|uniref:pentatricopeptide repeat-containing protein At2g27800, mitochondrial n=1 Tax=Musa acuminata AAA Group TaxID=214697 RepID=UPI0031D74B3E